MAYNASYYGSAAYNLELFEPRRQPKKHTRPADKPAKSHTANNTRTAAGVAVNTAANQYAYVDRAALAKNVSICAIAVITFALLIISAMQSHELTRSIEDSSDNLVALQQNYDAMLDTFNTQMSDTAVENYAVDVLGMQKRQYSQTEYVSLGSGDAFELSDTDDGVWLSSVLSYLN